MSSNSTEKLKLRPIDEDLRPPRFLDNSDKDSKKALASYANIGGWWRRGTPVPYAISNEIIKKIAKSSETVAAILEHASNDIAGAGYTFNPAPGVKSPSKSEHEKVVKFFKQPNPDDQGDEWLYDFIYDFLLYGDAYWEKTGKKDEEDVTQHPTLKKTWFGGELDGIWHIDTSTMKILHTMETGQMPDPESGIMAYEQKTLHGKVQFDSRKVARGSRFRQGRLYGESPLLPLLNIIAGQINLTGYIGNLFKGNVPKHLVNLGDITPENFKEMMLSIQEQMEQATNPFGVIGVNVPEGFEIKRLMETNREGAFLETLDYYRQEICSVFGIPPTKMGWSTPGRIGTPEELLDTWYDKIEHIHDRLEKIINRSIMPDLGINDWVIKFNCVRPKKTRLEAQALRDQSIAIRILRQEFVANVNEARAICGLEPIDEEWANDYQFLSPMLADKEGNNPGGLGTPHEGESMMPEILNVIDSLEKSVNELSDNLDEFKSDMKKERKKEEK